MTRLARLSLLLLFALPGCISLQSYQSAGPYVLHHRNWWNFYQRGRLYLKDGEFEKAAKDFETAMGRIPGARTSYAQERWKVRTYGMHMLESYFPHRELGICFFRQNRLDEALKLLETSIQMESSARAKFYINRIREQQAIANAPPPRIEPEPLPTWTAKRTLQLTGTATGSNAVSSLSVNEQPEFIELAKHRLHFSRALKLKEGQNKIQIIAKDLSGKRATTNLTVIADWTPPQITLHRQNGSPTVTCRDNLALGRIQLNGQNLSPTGKVWTLTVSSSESLELFAEDQAGNQIEWSLSQKELAVLAQNRLPAPPHLQVANSGKTITLYNPEYALDIRAEDDTALRSVELNGTPLLSADTPLFRTLRRVQLAPGTNRLVLTATDSESNQATEQVSVIYRPPEYLDSIYRLAAVLPPLTGEIPNPQFEQQTDRLITSELIREPVRFYLLAAEEETDRLTEEQILSASELADPRAKLRQNHQLDPDLRFVTRILSDGIGQTLYTTVFDTVKNEPLFIEDVYLENVEQLQQQIAGLVMKIEQRFPLIQANVFKEKNQWFIDAGEADGALTGMRFLVIRSEGNFEQGRVLFAGNRPAELVISGVESCNSCVILSSRHPGLSVQDGDYVFSR